MIAQWRRATNPTRVKKEFAVLTDHPRTGETNWGSKQTRFSAMQFLEYLKRANSEYGHENWRVVETQ